METMTGCDWFVRTAELQGAVQLELQSTRLLFKVLSEMV